MESNFCSGQGKIIFHDFITDVPHVRQEHYDFDLESYIFCFPYFFVIIG